MGKKPAADSPDKKPRGRPSKKNGKPKMIKSTQSNTANSVTDSETPKSAGPNDDLENYDVMYTKHVKQNLKTWEEGLLSYNNSSKHMKLFTRNTKAKCIDGFFPKVKPEFEIDEQLTMTKHLVIIEVRVYFKLIYKF